MATDANSDPYAYINAIPVTDSDRQPEPDTDPNTYLDAIRNAIADAESYPHGDLDA